jgi:GNAT superfamily N-acetyltransferase
MNEIIRLEKATEIDAEQIRDLMIKVEKDETNRWFDIGERPYIPGYDSIEMQKYHMWDDKYYKILSDERLIGVILITYTGREHARIDRLYIDTNVQSKGIGTRVIELIEKTYPNVKVWTLDTTQKSPRNHHFYEKNGYRLVGENEEERYYQKIIGESKNHSNEFVIGENFDNKNFRSCKLQNTDFYNVNLKDSHFTNMNMSNGTYQNSNLSHSRFTNTNISKSVLGDSNMSNVEICHVSLAGAHFHDTNLGRGEKKTPLVIERCELINSRIMNSNLQNLSIDNCNIEGMKIDGILVSDLLASYKMKT